MMWPFKTCKHEWKVLDKQRISQVEIAKNTGLSSVSTYVIVNGGLKEKYSTIVVCEKCGEIKQFSTITE